MLTGGGKRTARAHRGQRQRPVVRSCRRRARIGGADRASARRRASTSPASAFTSHAIFLESAVDGRAVFAIPWMGHTWIGTTDTDFDGDPATASATDDDVRYLIESVAPQLPAVRTAKNTGPAPACGRWCGRMVRRRREPHAPDHDGHVWPRIHHRQQADRLPRHRRGRGRPRRPPARTRCALHDELGQLPGAYVTGRLDDGDLAARVRSRCSTSGVSGSRTSCSDAARSGLNRTRGRRRWTQSRTSCSRRWTGPRRGGSRQWLPVPCGWRTTDARSARSARPTPRTVRSAARSSGWQRPGPRPGIPRSVPSSRSGRATSIRTQFICSL